MPSSNDQKTLQSGQSEHKKNRYLNILKSVGIPEKDHPRYVSEVETFLRVLRPSRLQDLPTKDVEAYLEELCTRTDLSDEQVRLSIGALRLLLLQLTPTPAGREIEWAAWLERRHSAIPEQTEDIANLREREMVMGSPRIAKATLTFPVLKDLSEAIQERHYSIRTEQAYLDWCHRFLVFCDKRETEEIEEHDLERFIEHLEVECGLAPKTRSAAYNAIAFFFQNVLDKPIEKLSAKKPRASSKVPMVLSRNEVRALLKEMTGVPGLMARLLYGTGMQLMECVRLRLIDVDLEKKQITVRNRKGEKDREIPLPERLCDPLNAQVEGVARQHQEDRASGIGAVTLPVAIAKEWPDAAYELGWQYLFPSGRLSRDAFSGHVGRTHLHPATLQRTLRVAGESAGIDTRISAQALRHAFASHVLESGTDIRLLQALLGHNDVATTMRYTRIMNGQKNMPVSSPLDTI
jgi:integron integrase